MKHTYIRRNFIRMQMVLSFLIAGISLSYGQRVRPNILIGTQLPLQYSIGLSYHVHPAISVRAQAGLLTKPYDRILLRIMEWNGLNKNQSRLIEQSVSAGLVASIGANYQLSPASYVGVMGQYIRLRGEADLIETLTTYFNRDFSFIESFGLASDIEVKSSLYTAGLLYGRKFTFTIPGLGASAEVGLVKIIASQSRFAASHDLVNMIAQPFYGELNQQFQSAYWRHGFLPTASVYLTYQF